MTIIDELRLIEDITDKREQIVRNAQVLCGNKSVKLIYEDKEYILSNAAYSALLTLLIYEAPVGERFNKED